MLKRLYQLLENLLGGSIARMLTGAGLTLVSYAALSGVLLGALNAAAAAFGGFADALYQITMLSGIGHALSIIGAAMMTRIALNSAALGIKKAATTS